MSKDFYKVLCIVLVLKLGYCLYLVQQYDSINKLLQETNQTLLATLVQFCGG